MILKKEISCRHTCAKKKLHAQGHYQNKIHPHSFLERKKVIAHERVKKNHTPVLRIKVL